MLVPFCVSLVVLIGTAQVTTDLNPAETAKDPPSSTMIYREGGYGEAMTFLQTSAQLPGRLHTHAQRISRQKRSDSGSLPFLAAVPACCVWWGSWGPWGDCVCDTRRQSRYRYCQNGCSAWVSEWKTCFETFCTGQAQIPSLWSEWGPCSATCEAGFRTRYCVNDGCGRRRIEQGDCVVPILCPDNCCSNWGAWSRWGACSPSCLSGNKERRRSCAMQFCVAQGWQSLSCDALDCSPQSSWSNWGIWSVCSVTCGGGFRTRYRTCEGSFCSGDNTQREDCGARVCPVPPRWSAWSAWGTCSVTCGRGRSQRTRYCVTGSCFGNSQEARDCRQRNCPVPPRWSAWSAWGTCSVTCGRGRSQRTRYCVTGSCFGNSQEARDCRQRNCPAWGPWLPWSVCSRTCGGGTTTRTRRCQGGSNCPGPNSESKDCQTQRCPEWGPWLQWSDCSVSCGSGSNVRGRRCVGGSSCRGNDLQTRSCQAQECPEWGQWTEWSCSVSCAMGTDVRIRDCEGVGPCKGVSKETRPCFAGPCNEWGQWTEWSCSVSCAMGTGVRTRDCEGVGPCKGVSKETRLCFAGPCNGQWGPWEPWGDCSTTCDPGKKTRKRTCPPTFLCVGESVEEDECVENECEGEWGPWSSWGECSTTCGGGKRTRDRKCRGNCAGHAVQWELCGITPCQVNVAEGRNINELPLPIMKKLEKRFSSDTLEVLVKFRQTWTSNLAFLYGDNSKSPLYAEQLAWWESLAAERVQMMGEGRHTLQSKKVLKRKEYRLLTPSERELFHAALIRSKNAKRGGISEYDIFVRVHQAKWAPGAHFGAASLPWHREYLFRFERMLQQYDPEVSLPYWDPTLDHGLPDPRDSVLWGNSFMGSATGRWNTNWATYWPLVEECQIYGSKLLHRGSQSGKAFSLPKIDFLNLFLDKITYKELVDLPSVDWELGLIHTFVGGLMENVACSPSDPIFFLYHAYIDYIWQQFRSLSQMTEIDKEYPKGKLTGESLGGMYHFPYIEMRPFGPLQNIDGLQTVYQDNYYTYPQRLPGCGRHRDCGGYLFCHKGRCMSKIKLGGNCTGTEEGSSAPCECGTCEHGLCVGLLSCSN